LGQRFNYNWDLPVGRGKQFWNLVPGVDPVNPGWHANCNNAVTQVCPYVNALAVFTPPSLLSVGTATRVLDNIRMPHTVSYNMAILKDFPIHEEVRLAFRAELYGALNHPNFRYQPKPVSLIHRPELCGRHQSRCDKREY
jgi:hypothetical protein